MLLKLLFTLAGASLLVPSLLAAGFADSFADYRPGAGATYTNAASALSEPSRFTAGAFPGPVDPFSPAYLGEQIVSLGQGGSITLRFGSPIQNDPVHPFGLDFIVFGNSGFSITNNDFSGGGITDGTLFGANSGATRVSVSSDGAAFYELSSALAPVVDGPFPTDGAGDFHLPLHPALTPQSFAGKSLAEIRSLYAGSAGGTAFDLSWARDSQGEPVTLASASYVRIEVLSGVAEIDGVSAVSRPGIAPILFAEDFTAEPADWRAHGETNLFGWNAGAGSLDVTWDSSRTNSYFYLPLGLTLTRADDFRLAFTLSLDEIQIGTTEGKPFTFQIAAGLLNTTNAFDPEMFRGTGIDPAHGPRNLVEFNYFPDSGFGATIAPSVVTESNQIAFSGNHPFELVPAEVYRVEMSFDGTLQTLSTRMWKNGEPFPSEGLKTLQLGPEFADFRLNALAIASYSDAGQSPQFAGSVRARGSIDDVELLVFHRPKLAMVKGAGTPLAVEFPTEDGWTYHLETSSDLAIWRGASGPHAGTGGLLRVPVTFESSRAFFRARPERSTQ
jgi:hypothetical protein